MEKKKKILLFHPALAPYRIDQFNAINELFDVEIVFVFDNVWNHNFDQNKLLNQLTCTYSFLLFGPRYKGLVFRFGILRKIIKSKPDIVISYEYSFTTIYLVLLKRLGLINQQIGTMVDDNIDISVNVNSNFKKKLIALLVKRFDFIVVLSNEVSAFYRKTYLKNENQLIVSPILQNQSRLRKDKISLEAIANINLQKYELKNKKVILFIGRFIAEKGLPQFITNISSILTQTKDLMFVIVGDGDDKDTINQIIKSNNLESKIILPGRFEGNDLLSWYLCASGFVLPSTYEPFGAVVNEALIFGLPVLCSKYAGSAYLIKNEFGLLFNPKDKDDVLHKIETFINSIPVKDEISLDKSKVLLSFDDFNFKGQWGKLYND